MLSDDDFTEIYNYVKSNWKLTWIIAVVLICIFVTMLAGGAKILGHIQTLNGGVNKTTTGNINKTN